MFKYHKPITNAVCIGAVLTSELRNGGFCFYDFQIRTTLKSCELHFFCSQRNTYVSQPSYIQGRIKSKGESRTESRVRTVCAEENFGHEVRSMGVNEVFPRLSIFVLHSSVLVDLSCNRSPCLPAWVGGVDGTNAVA